MLPKIFLHFFSIHSLLPLFISLFPSSYSPNHQLSFFSHHTYPILIHISIFYSFILSSLFTSSFAFSSSMVFLSPSLSLLMSLASSLSHIILMSNFDMHVHSSLVPSHWKQSLLLFYLLIVDILPSASKLLFTHIKLLNGVRSMLLLIRSVNLFRIASELFALGGCDWTGN